MPAAAAAADVNAGLVPPPLALRNDGPPTVFEVLAPLLEFAARKAISEAQPGIVPEARLTLRIRQALSQDAEAGTVLEAVVVDNGSSGASAICALASSAAVTTAAAVTADDFAHALPLQLRAVWHAFMSCNAAPIRATTAIAGAEFATLAEYRMDPESGRPAATSPRAQMPKPAPACGTTVQVTLPFGPEELEGALPLLCGFHWIAGSNIKLSLTSPDSHMFVAVPHMATANRLMENGELNAAVMGRAAAECLQRTIRVPDVAVAETEWIGGMQMQVAMILQREDAPAPGNGDAAGPARSVPLLLHALVDSQPLLLPPGAAAAALLAAAAAAVQWRAQLGVDFSRRAAHRANGHHVGGSTLQLTAPTGSGLLLGVEAVHVVCNAIGASGGGEGGGGAQGPELADGGLLQLGRGSVAVPYAALLEEACAPRMCYIAQLPRLVMAPIAKAAAAAAAAAAAIEGCAQQLSARGGGGGGGRGALQRRAPSTAFTRHTQPAQQESEQLLAGIARNMAACIVGSRSAGHKAEIMDLLNIDDAGMEPRRLARELQQRLTTAVHMAEEAAERRNRRGADAAAEE
ncbi:hypothetical protein JKP88DRAFT_275352 [Tribonema minus]|uniref:Uncharacterized protein n=1 Tax=Tribonema minus TaxID=303371 RepID=A0A835ZFN9_9STRA|nr:hypothetical protein JKP88DRAFT_275352 [Tribonema minus]